MEIKKEIEALRKRVKLLEEFRELQNKVEELEKQIAKPIVPYVPYYPVYPPYDPNPYPWWKYWTVSDDNTSMLTDSQRNMTFSS